MINPNIHKRIKAEVLEPIKNSPLMIEQYALIDGIKYEIYYRKGDRIKKKGSRYLYVNYSIIGDCYYLTCS